jgi:hypothetical protein
MPHLPIQASAFFPVLSYGRGLTNPDTSGLKYVPFQHYNGRQRDILYSEVDEFLTDWTD